MKDIIILCAGPSIKDLAKNIEEFKEINVPYLLINGYENVYRDTFGLIGKVAKYVSIYADGDNHMTPAMVKEFVKGSTIFLTNEHSYTVKFRNSGIDYTVIDPDVDRDIPTNRTNSMTKMIVYLSSIGYERIFIYGCNGHKADGPTHYRLDKKFDESNRIRDTKNINDRMEGHFKDYNVNPLVYNCCVDSAITCFPIVTVSESIRMMKSEL